MSLSERFQKALATMPRGSQAAMARHCGVKPPSVSEWVSGRTREIEGSNLVKAAEFLGVRVKWLAEGLGPMRETGLSSYTEKPAATEPTPIFKLPAWPFHSIKPDDWSALPASAQAQIEAYAEGVIAAHGAKSKKTIKSVVKSK